MKIVFKKILQYYLKYIVKIILLIHRPFIIAIAGSSNKIFAKEKIISLLKEKGIDAYSNPKSFNTEIGLPLAILDLPSGYNSYADWLSTVLKAPIQIFKINFPKILVLELGISSPADMKFLLSIIKPDIGVITQITSRYLESFKNIGELLAEYEYFIKKMPKESLLVLNYDNLFIRKMANINKNKVLFFGFSDKADWQGKLLKKDAFGQKILIRHGEKKEEYNLKKYGEHHIYSLLISLIVKEYVSKKEV
jgi:UDP-N-acetylmuramoyl-tripeptide--D-alanyl-D-alanine ligase